MNPDFWQARWEQGQLGFHQAEVNALLQEHWGALDLASSDLVFVPLCGKSLDLWWLRDRGHPVLGVELSPIAVHDFFREAGVEPETSRRGSFDVSKAKGVTLLRGDFFDVAAADLAEVRGVYDRAALIALPPDLRPDYARALARHLPRAARMLLVSFESDPPGWGGPPFSVAESEVRELFEPAFTVEVLHRGPFTEPRSALKERGLESAADVVYAIRRR